MDEFGRPLTTEITFTLTLSEWWLIRNQLSNMAATWRRDGIEALAIKCETLTAKIDAGPMTPEEDQTDGCQPSAG